MKRIVLAIGSLVLCVASSAGAQEDVERGKILYASECARCHKSPESVSTFHGGVDLETFLGVQHYADTPESAAAIAAYLKGLIKPPPLPSRRPRHHRRTSEASPAEPTLSGQTLADPPAQSSEDSPIQRAFEELFQAIKEKSNQ